MKRALSWLWNECRKIWLDTLAPGGKYGFNRMMAFTTFWTALPLTVWAFWKQPELRYEILILLFAQATGSKIVNTIDKKRGTENFKPENQQNSEVM